jgi:hypothetical protein
MDFLRGHQTLQKGVFMAQKSETKKETKEMENQTDKEQKPRTTVSWDDSKISSTYANVCNVSSTREEVTLLFGTNQTWHTGQQQLTVLLNNRIILNPFAAKRLSVILNNVMNEYESRFGKLQIEASR